MKYSLLQSDQDEKLYLYNTHDFSGCFQVLKE
jgi:hypothetical protein